MSSDPSSHGAGLGAVAVLAGGGLVARPCSGPPARPPARRPTTRRRYQDASLPDRAARRRPARPDDAGGEDRPDDPGRARSTSTPTPR